MYKCPYPNCTHVAAYAILNSHAKTHGYKTVTEMCREHGPVTQPKMDPKKLKHYRDNYLSITESSYNNVENAVARMKKTDRSELSNRQEEKELKRFRIDYKIEGYLTVDAKDEESAYELVQDKAHSRLILESNSTDMEITDCEER